MKSKVPVNTDFEEGKDICIIPLRNGDLIMFKLEEDFSIKKARYAPICYSKICKRADERFFFLIELLALFCMLMLIFAAEYSQYLFGVIIYAFMLYFIHEKRKEKTREEIIKRVAGMCENVATKLEKRYKEIMDQINQFS